VVSDDCARHLAATFIVHCERSDKLDALCSAAPQRDTLTASDGFLVRRLVCFRVVVSSQ
jgi:hypothetical protein